MSDSPEKPQNPTSSAPAEPDKKRYFTPPADSPSNTFSAEATPIITSAVKTIRLEDFTKVHLQPCARESLLAGMGLGFVFGGLRFVVGGKVSKACNWAVGSFVMGSLASYEICQYKRRAEKEGMKRAAQIMEYKKKEMEKKQALKMEMAAKKKAEEQAKRKPWYKVW